MPQIDTDLITQSEYARHRVCTREAVRKAVASGRISAFGPDQRINAALADSQWLQNTRSRARPGAHTPGGTTAPPAGPGLSGAPPADVAPGVPGYDVSRARREQAEARMAELKLQRELRSVLDRSDVRNAVADVATRIRVELEGLADTLAHQLAYVSDESLIRTTIAIQVERVLQRMADGFASVDGAGNEPEQHGDA